MNEEKKINKKYIIAILAALVIIGGWFLFFGKMPSQTQPISVEKEIILQKQAGDIINTGDIKACDQIDNDMYKSVCRNNIALELAQKNLDIKGCENIENETTKGSCLLDVSLKSAIQNKSALVCESIKDEKSRAQCVELYYVNTAVNKSGEDTCANIADVNGKTLCQDTNILYDGFSLDSSKFNCEQFKSENSINDCKAFQEIVKTQPGPMDTFCAYFKTNLFKRFCTQQPNIINSSI
ncbi:hypothetical protein MNBD_BACTEROID05-650 [hydrothermal vent metagenome]|uniref:Transmembrane protein n=1 Tax=hydrothermal vent metagenome TaxID=652676 RepID=A0A3B0TH96_9ZZZZ